MRLENEWEVVDVRQYEGQAVVSLVSTCPWEPAGTMQWVYGMPTEVEDRTGDRFEILVRRVARG